MSSYEKQGGLSFDEGQWNEILLEQMRQPPTNVADMLIVESQTPGKCWAAETDASKTYGEKWSPTLGKANTYFE